MSYKQLDLDDRIAIRFGLMQKLSLREIARQLNRSPSTISREIRRNRVGVGDYLASDAHAHSKSRRVDCRPKKKLAHDSTLFELVAEMLRDRLSPEQIAGNLRTMYPQDRRNYVCHETIYNVSAP